MTHIQIITKQTSARDYIKRNAPSAIDQDHKHSPYSSQREIAAGRPLISDEFTTFMCQTAGLILSVLIELQPFYFRFSCVISE